MRRTLLIILAVLAVGLGGCSSAFGLKGDKVREQADGQAADGGSSDGQGTGGQDGNGAGTDPSGGDQAQGGDPEAGVGGSEGVPSDPLLEGFQQGVPADWPSDVPVPDNATDVYAASGAGLPIPDAQGRALVMTVPGSQEEVTRSYSDALRAAGWGESPLLGMFGGSTEGAIVMSKGDRTVLALPTQATGESSQLMVMVIQGDLATLLQQAPGQAPG